jgi:hypothetical protein
MSKQTGKFASAIFVGIFASVSLTTMSNSAARAATDCLPGPRGQTPPGGHWYYRVDQVTKRHCWHLREEREGLSRAAPQNLAPPQARISSRQETDTRLSFAADAHAELPIPLIRIGTPNRAETPVTAKPADSASIENSPRAGVEEANMQRSEFASRWPQQFATTATVNPVLTTNKVEPSESIEPASLPSLAQFVDTARQLAITASYSPQLQLAPLLGALAIACILARGIFKFGGSRRARVGNVRARRNTIWEPTDDDGLRLSAYTGAKAYARRSHFARDYDRAMRNDRIAEFFTQLSRRAPT